MIPEFGGDMIQWLRGFYHIVEAGSIVAATKSMARNQPTLSHQIKRLEEAFGIKIFEGNKGNRRLTREGELLLQMSIDIFDRVKKTKDQFLNTSGKFKGQISIVTYPAVLDCILPNYIVNFQNANPQIDFKLEGRYHEDVLRLVEFGAFDFGIASADRIPNALIAHPLFTSNMVLMTPRSGPLWIREQPTLDQIAGLPLIMFPSSTTVTPHIHRQFANSGFSVKSSLTLNHYETIKKYVQLGLGVAIFHEYAISMEDRKRLEIYSLKESFSGQLFVIIHRKNMYTSPQTEAFLSDLEGIKPKIA